MADVQEPKNALWRREEQLRRWDLSETNKESAEPRNREHSKIKFQDGCIFLAACSSGDKDEVERLIGRGADINTANIDGLTALHQVRFPFPASLLLDISKIYLQDKFQNLWSRASDSWVTFYDPLSGW